MKANVFSLSTVARHQLMQFCCHLYCENTEVQTVELRSQRRPIITKLNPFYLTLLRERHLHRNMSARSLEAKMVQCIT